jgi:hypothetical protein
MTSNICCKDLCLLIIDSSDFRKSSKFSCRDLTWISISFVFSIFFFCNMFMTAVSIPPAFRRLSISISCLCSVSSIMILLAPLSPSMKVSYFLSSGVGFLRYFQMLRITGITFSVKKSLRNKRSTSESLSTILYI